MNTIFKFPRTCPPESQRILQWRMRSPFGKPKNSQYSLNSLLFNSLPLTLFRKVSTSMGKIFQLFNLPKFLQCVFQLFAFTKQLCLLFFQYFLPPRYQSNIWRQGLKFLHQIKTSIFSQRKDISLGRFLYRQPLPTPFNKYILSSFYSIIWF